MLQMKRKKINKLEKIKIKGKMTFYKFKCSLMKLDKYKKGD